MKNIQSNGKIDMVLFKNHFRKSIDRSLNGVEEQGK
jgi:hypothetical protein